MPALTLDLSRGMAVSGGSGDPLAVTAANELTRALGPFRNSGRNARPISIRLEQTGGVGRSQGFRWRASPGEIVIAGDDPHGLLYGTFDFLEAVGCAWPAPGDAWTRGPTSPQVQLALGEHASAPALFGRSLIIGHHAFLEDGEEWITWAARNRLTTIFFHIDDHGLALGAAPGKQWRAKRGELLALCRRYGMTIELGGHGMPHLVPRGLFTQKPQLFRMARGERRADGNFCAASPETLQIVAESAAAWFKENPGADVYHLWPDDQPSGAWCACPKCARLSPSDQAMHSTNAIADALSGIDPNAKISFLSYHDTEEPPATVAPRFNVVMTFAPRLRCYAQGLDDPGSAVNARYPDLFRRNVRMFGELDGEATATESLDSNICHSREGGNPDEQPPGALDSRLRGNDDVEMERSPGRCSPSRAIRVFEYYLDAILFKVIVPPLLAVMQRDLAFYARNGAHTVGALLTGSGPFIAPNINAYAFARLAWDPAQSLTELRERFCRLAFGEDTHLPRYYELAEKAFALALDLDPREIALTARTTLDAIIDDPPSDVGDPLHAPDDRLPVRQELIEEASKLMDEAFEHLETAQGRSDRLASLRDENEILTGWIKVMDSRLALEQMRRKPRSEKTADELSRLIAATESWIEDLCASAGIGKLEHRYRRNTRILLWLFWRLRLERIARTLLEDPEAAKELRLAGLERAKRIFAIAASLWSDDPGALDELGLE